MGKTQATLAKECVGENERKGDKRSNDTSLGQQTTYKRTKVSVLGVPNDVTNVEQVPARHVQEAQPNVREHNERTGYMTQTATYKVSNNFT